MGKSKFSSLWLADDRVKSWLSPVPARDDRARCTACSVNFDVSNMGVAAVVSHMHGKMIKEKLENKAKSPMARFVLPRVTSPGSATSSSSDRSTSTEAATQSQARSSCLSTDGSGSGALPSFVSNDAVLAAELYWALHVITCSQVGDLFRTMFPDSGIVSKFACGERKRSYLTAFGIARVFADMLSSKVKETSDFVLLFDENLNQDLQSKRLDVHIRLWDAGRVSTPYCTSDFLGHAAADILQDKLSEAVCRFGRRGISCAL